MSPGVKPEEPDITVFLCRIKRSKSDIETIAWIDPCSARQYCEDQTPIELEWRKEEDGRRVGEAGGDILATIDEVDVADPIKLSQEFPDQMRSWQYIDPSEL